MKRPGGVKTAYFSLAANLAYVGYTAALGLTQRSVWFLVLASYYTVLSVMRFAALRCEGKETETFVPRFVGVMFLVLSATLAAVTYLAFEQGHGT